MPFLLPSVLTSLKLFETLYRRIYGSIFKLIVSVQENDSALYDFYCENLFKDSRSVVMGDTNFDAEIEAVRQAVY